MNTTTMVNKAITSDNSFNNYVSSIASEIFFFAKMFTIMSAFVLFLISAWV